MSDEDKIPNEDDQHQSVISLAKRNANKFKEFVKDGNDDEEFRFEPQEKDLEKFSDDEIFNSVAEQIKSTNKLKSHKKADTL